VFDSCTCHLVLHKTPQDPHCETLDHSLCSHLCPAPCPEIRDLLGVRWIRWTLYDSLYKNKVCLCLSVSVSHRVSPCLTPWALVLKCSATFTHSGQDHFCFHEFLFCTLSHPLGPTVNRNFQFANLAASLVLASAASASDK
jgi:hypothetical protein